MDKNLESVIKQRIERTAKALNDNGMETYVVKDENEVRETLRSLLSENDKIAVGGSATLNECGILDLIRDKKYRFIDRYEKDLDGEEIRRRFVASFDSDVFISGTNAVTENGELYNVDGTGNRIAALAFGPKSVVIIVGYNKIVKDLDDAVKRVKTTAAPANTKRLSCNTYCKEFGECAAVSQNKTDMTSGCGSDNRICCDYLVLAKQRKRGRIKVIIVEKELGF